MSMSNLRQFARFASASLLHYSGAFDCSIPFRRGARKVCVLGLHRVLTRAEQRLTNSLDGMTISDETFLALLRYLDRHFQVSTLGMLQAAKEQRADHSKPCCLLTFDDGWKDTYRSAYPLLKKFGMPAVVFITTGSVGKSEGFWVEQLKRVWSISSVQAKAQELWRQICEKKRTPLELENLVERLKHMPAENRDVLLSKLFPAEENDNSENVDSMLTWQEVVELSRNGVEIGAHTVSHPLLTYENDTTVDRELRSSKQTLEEKIGNPIRAFAYPNGDYDARVRQFVQQAGYEFAFTTEPGCHRRGEDPFSIRRILLHEGNITGPDGQFSPAMFRFTLSGRP
jgi:peptidoglycan/xylan/chitin deacetylase (PgdA/CDA1 family)